MAEFKDAKLWMKLAFLMIMLGFTLDLFAFATDMAAGWEKSSIEAMLIIGLICFLVAAVLGLCLLFLDECKDNKIVTIIFIVVCFVAGIATVIGIAIWGGEEDDSNSEISDYPAAEGVLGSLLAILAGIFGILSLLGVGGK